MKLAIYSNGIVDFIRSYTVTGKTPINIPVNKQYVGDVLGSLNVRGDANVVENPSFIASKGSVDLDLEDVYVDLAVKFAGAQVSLMVDNTPYVGRLCGVQRIETEVKNKISNIPSIALYTENGYELLPLDLIKSIKFIDPSVQSEVDRLLDEKLAAIRPNSDVIRFVAEPQPNKGEVGEVTVQYAVPVASWKISYRVRLEDKGGRLYGFAIVHNSTEEDWKNCDIKLVTGQPITFDTDLAEVKLPRRSKVETVNRDSFGAMESVAACSVGGASASRSAKRLSAFPSDDGNSMHQCASGGAPAAPFDPESFAPRSSFDVMPTAEEAGDFTVFTTKNANVPANSSAVIPVFNYLIEDMKPVLYYTSQRNAVYGSIRFKNTSTTSFGRGPCSVNERDDSFVGNCVVPNVKPGADALLSHAVDTGVKLVENEQKSSYDLVSFKLTKGLFWGKRLQKQVSSLEFQNQHDESFELVLDQARKINGKISVYINGEKHASVAKIEGGVRVTNVVLPPKSSIKVEFEECRVIEEKLEGVTQNQLFNRLGINHGNSPLLKNEKIQSIIAQQTDIESLESEIVEAEEQRESLYAEQTRLLNNFTATNSPGFKEDLLLIENEIKPLVKGIQNLKTKKKLLETALTTYLQKLSLEWEDETN